MGVMASHITSLSIVYSTVCSGVDQRKHQSSASLAFVRGIHRWPASNAENVSIWWRHHAPDFVELQRSRFAFYVWMSETWANKRKRYICSDAISCTNFQKDWVIELKWWTKQILWYMYWSLRWVSERFLAIHSCFRIHSYHEDIMTWKGFPHYWPIAGKIHRLPRKGPLMWGLIFLRCWPKQTVEKTAEFPVIWDVGPATWHHCTLQWCHNGRDGVSNHQRLDCLLNRLFRRR